MGGSQIQGILGYIVSLKASCITQDLNRKRRKEEKKKGKKKNTGFKHYVDYLFSMRDLFALCFLFSRQDFSVEGVLAVLTLAP